MINLTPREIQVLSELAKGKSNEEIAKSLGIAKDTVKMYLKTVFTKLNVTNRVAAAVKAVILGVIETNELTICS